MQYKRNPDTGRKTNHDTERKTKTKTGKKAKKQLAPEKDNINNNLKPKATQA